MYVKVVIITCQEKFPAAHSLDKIQGSVAVFSNCTRSLYLVNDCRHSRKTHRKPRAHKGLLYPCLVNLLLTVQTFSYKNAFPSTELHQSCLGCIQWNQPDLPAACYWGSLLITCVRGNPSHYRVSFTEDFAEATSQDGRMLILWVRRGWREGKRLRLRGRQIGFASWCHHLRAVCLGESLQRSKMFILCNNNRNNNACLTFWESLGATFSRS